MATFERKPYILISLEVLCAVILVISIVALILGILSLSSHEEGSLPVIAASISGLVTAAFIRGFYHIVKAAMLYNLNQEDKEQKES